MTDPDPRGNAKGFGIFVILISGRAGGVYVLPPGTHAGGGVHVGSVIWLSIIVTIVCANALPFKLALAPSVTAAVSVIIVPIICAPALIAIDVGICQNTLHASAQLVSVIIVLPIAVMLEVLRKIYTPAPLSVSAPSGVVAATS